MPTKIEWVKNEEIDNILGRMKTDAWREGFDDAVKYIFEPCTEHHFGISSIVNLTLLGNTYVFKHRYLCRQCMAELEERGKND